jgi:predicted GNAT family N-acyltransferase
MSVEFSQISVAAILGLRHRILRPGFPPSTAEFIGDDDPGTIHFGAKLNRDVVSCLSLYVSEWQGSTAWQLRGMATDAAFQGQGLGRQLLDYAVAEAVTMQPSWPIWCNARVSAVGFYSKANWTVESEQFEIEGVGPHVRMLCSRL